LAYYYDRYEHDGQAILVLAPHEEEEMLNELKQKKIPISRLQYAYFLDYYYQGCQMKMKQFQIIFKIF
jgi:hypothetical protein